MKKLITSLALAGLSFPLVATDVAAASLQLEAGQQLEVTSVVQMRLNEGEKEDNVWFALDPAQLQGAVDYQLSNCVLTADISLNAGELLFTGRNLRCPSITGDVYTATELDAQWLTENSRVCQSSAGKCTQAHFNTSSLYRVQLQSPASLDPAYNAAKEVNRLRLEEQINGSSAAEGADQAN